MRPRRPPPRGSTPPSSLPRSWTPGGRPGSRPLCHGRAAEHSLTAKRAAQEPIQAPVHKGPLVNLKRAGPGARCLAPPPPPPAWTGLARRRRVHGRARRSARTPPPPAAPPCRYRFACIRDIGSADHSRVRSTPFIILQMKQIEGDRLDIRRRLRTNQPPHTNALNFFCWTSRASPATIPNESLKNTESWFSWCTVKARRVPMSAGKGGPGNAPTCGTGTGAGIGSKPGRPGPTPATLLITCERPVASSSGISTAA